MSALETSPLKILLIEDNPGDARLIREMLLEASGAACVLESVACLSAGLQRLAEDTFDVVLLDLSLPDAAGLRTFERVNACRPDLPIIVLTGLDDESVAVGAVQAGAQDYLLKGHVDPHELRLAMRYAIERKRLEADRNQMLARERIARAEAERLAAERAAVVAAQRELERQKDEFVANVSHDLRTPVAAIKASIGVILANEPPAVSEPLHRLFTNIDRAADEMARLVDDLLELARLRAGRVQLRPVVCDLRELAERSAHVIATLAETRAQTVEVDVPDEPVHALADSERLSRALTNLLSNAHKYGRVGGTIRVLVRRSADDVRLGVADDGPGIAEHDQAHIFDRFYRSETEATRRNLGSGLGLPIARAMVELHGGRIWVESALGRGTTFWIALPAARSLATVAGKERAP